MSHPELSHRPVSRREMLRAVGCSFGSLALAGLCASAHGATSSLLDPLAPRAPVFPARARRVIFLFMQGGPSHVDTFDPKPRLQLDDGKKIDFNVARTRKVESRTVFAAVSPTARPHRLSGCAPASSQWSRCWFWAGARPIDCGRLTLHAGAPLP